MVQKQKERLGNMDIFRAIPFQEQVLDKLQELEETCKYTKFRSEVALDVGLRGISERKLLKEKIETLENYSASLFKKEPVLESQEPNTNEAELEELFNKLSKQWKEETVNISSYEDKVLHPAYLKIIALGKNATPLILKELDKEYNFWFTALIAITQSNPVTEDMGNDIDAIRKAWLDWGRKNAPY